MDDYKPVIVVDDDNEEVGRLFKLKALKANVEIVFFQTWDKTKEFLESGANIDAIVLDAKGQITADDDANEAHLLESLIYVRNLLLPYVIYTAYTDEIPGLLANELKTGKVFTKTKHKEEDIFDYLIKEIAKTPKLKIFIKYPKTFKVFKDGFINIKGQFLLLDILFCIEKEDYNKSNLNKIRDLLELIYKSFVVDYNLIPSEFLNNRGNPNLQWCTLYFAGKTVNITKEDPLTKTSTILPYLNPYIVPGSISWSFTYVKEISSELSHLSEDAIAKNLFIASAHALIEIIEWIPNFITENKIKRKT